MNDTTIEMRKKQLEIIFSKTPKERFMLGVEIINSVRTIVENSIKLENPGISKIDLKIAVFKRYYSKDFSENELNKIILSMKEYHNT
ncbi:unnamed protein product [marine sediment metagenome]|uniref:Uncharacterized protein n=1 Tax=marine sediment metagenome TaxID=412755 RepID=X1LBN6_9ZZZZ